MSEDSTVHNRGDTAEDSDKVGLQINQWQCLNLRGRNVSCTRCADICPSKALKLTAESVHLDAGLCTRCGACLPACPSGAMQLSDFDPRRFLEALTGKAEEHVCCSRVGNTDDGNIIPCLQVLDARLLAAAAAGGTKTVVLHGASQCSGCERGDARAAIEHMHADLEAWFSEAPLQLRQGSSVSAATGGHRDQQQVHLGRRKFLRFAGTYVANSASEWLTDAAAEPQGTSAQRPLFPSDGSAGRPSAYHVLLAGQAASLPWRDGQLPWHYRVLSEVCNTCLACTQHCPTGALVAEETTATVSIWFRLQACTDCGLCERLCPEGAISRAAATSPDELHAPPLQVIHRSLRQCTVCARSFDPGSDSAELCTHCQNEQDVMNDWKAMFSDPS